MGLARRRDLMQRAARKPAAERAIDRRNAQGLAARIAVDPGRFFQRPQGLAELRDHA